ncbi:MAG: hypothetical protein JST15_13055 [Bacteroidetes bacterium]|nr:hypothetical protein [Bacteroidota bacterium]
MILPVNPQKKFINCIYNNDYYGLNDAAKYSIYGNIPRYVDSLNFNSIQIYGGLQGGAFDSALNSYSTQVSGLMEKLDTSGLKVLYGRDKISKLCYGQRLEYEAEGGNDGFSYSRRYADVITDNGRTVLHPCITDCDATPRLLCDSIYENLQHCNIVADFFSVADTGVWYLKPVMRIDTSDFSSTDSTPVVRIDAINFEGNLIKSATIRVRNFKNSNFEYLGGYISEFNFIDEPPSTNLNVSGNLVSGLNAGRDDDHLDLCKVDFKIYWFGQVDVWFDKLIVDDEMGNNLFNANPDIRNIFETKVTEEIDAFRSSNLHPSNYAYYVDEMVYSNIPCIKRVTELMDSIDAGSRLTCATTNYLNTRGLRNDTLGNRVFFQKLNPELFTNDAHEIPGMFPNNLTLREGRFNQIAISSSISSYQNELQLRFGDKTRAANENQGSLVHQINFAREQRNLYAPNAQFIMQPQLHSFFIQRFNSSPEWSGIREPTNEEIQAQAMLTIAHGADGIGWVTYQSTVDSIPGSRVVTGHGMLYYPYYPPEATPRLKNIFGQNKWAYVGNMNRKIKNWIPTLDQTKWKSGYSIHSETATHEFIHDIKSLKRDPYNQYIEDSPCTYCDAQNQRYWEMGFFDPDFNNLSVSSIDKSKYFLMVNRRCVPDTPASGQGDFRGLSIKFDSTKLDGFRNWKIVDVNTNLLVRTFDKDSNIYVNMGEFNPGEGKLYKLSPVMQEGGTLVADEEVSNIQFVCNGTVLNNGKNITIGSGTEIFFREGAGINMTGGNFICDGSSGIGNILLQGIYRELWNGINLINTGSSTKIEKTTFENTKSPVVIDNSQFGPQYAQKIIRRNIFYITQDSGIALRIRNQFAMLIDSNTFDVSNNNSTSGIYFSNYSDPGPAGGTTDDNCFVNITNNTF